MTVVVAWTGKQAATCDAGHKAHPEAELRARAIFAREARAPSPEDRWPPVPREK